MRRQKGAFCSRQNGCCNSLHLINRETTQGARPAGAVPFLWKSWGGTWCTNIRTWVKRCKQKFGQLNENKTSKPILHSGSCFMLRNRLTGSLSPIGEQVLHCTDEVTSSSSAQSYMYVLSRSHDPSNSTNQEFATATKIRIFSSLGIKHYIKLHP